MLGLIKKKIIGLLTGLVIASNYTKCMLLSNHKCTIQPTLINLHPNEYSQEFPCYPFGVKLDKCVESCNILNDLWNKVCVPNKTEDLNLSKFSMITGTNESKTLTKHISCGYKCRFNGRKLNSDGWWNNNKSWCECKKRHVCEKNCVWNPSTCSCENGKCLASIMDNSVITCDDIIESYDNETKTIPTNFNEEETTCRTQRFYILLAFFIITIALLIAVSIYCYLIKYRANQKHLLSFQFTNNKLKI